MGFFDLFKKKKEEPTVAAEANSEEITTVLNEGEAEAAEEVVEEAAGEVVEEAAEQTTEE